MRLARGEMKWQKLYFIELTHDHIKCKERFMNPLQIAVNFKLIEKNASFLLSRMTYIRYFISYTLYLISYILYLISHIFYLISYVFYEWIITITGSTKWNLKTYTSLLWIRANFRRNIFWKFNYLKLLLYECIDFNGIW